MYFNISVAPTSMLKCGYWFFFGIGQCAVEMTGSSLELAELWQDGAMRISIDIPDALYRQLTAKAARARLSVEELILRGVEMELRLPQAKKGTRVTFPLIRSKQPGSLEIDNAKIFEIIQFP
jgi:hypothetical protein